MQNGKRELFISLHWISHMRTDEQHKIQKTSEQCKFFLVGGKSARTHRFKKGFSGLISVVAEFHKVIGNLLKEFSQANVFIDDILIVSKGKKIKHIALTKKTYKKLDVANVALKMKKCEFAKSKFEWLDFKTGKDGTTLLVR